MTYLVFGIISVPSPCYTSPSTPYLRLRERRELIQLPNSVDLPDECTTYCHLFLESLKGHHHNVNTLRIGCRQHIENNTLSRSRRHAQDGVLPQEEGVGGVDLEGFRLDLPPKEELIPGEEQRGKQRFR